MAWNKMDTSKHTVTLPIDDYNSMLEQIKSLNEVGAIMAKKLEDIDWAVNHHFCMTKHERFDRIKSILEQ